MNVKLVRQIISFLLTAVVLAAVIAFSGIVVAVQQ